jgi:hypothetical protein
LETLVDTDYNYYSRIAYTGGVAVLRSLVSTWAHLSLGRMNNIESSLNTFRTNSHERKCSVLHGTAKNVCPGYACLYTLEDVSLPDLTKIIQLADSLLKNPPKF